MAARRNHSNHLDRRAWVNGAIDLLCTSGMQSVRVEALAKKLNISKGSFYWHFKDREDLLQAIVDEWQARQSDWNAGNNSTQTPVERWTKLFEIVSAAGYATLELAMATWARQDERVARRLAEADRKRVAYLSTVFREIGFTHAQAAEWANAAFSLYLGWMDRSTRKPGGDDAGPAIAESLSRLVLAASALASQEALQQSKR